METPIASTSAIPYDATPAMEVDESEAATSEGDESEEVEAAVISRGRRSNAGSRYAVPLPSHIQVSETSEYSECEHCWIKRKALKLKTSLLKKRTIKILQSSKVRPCCNSDTLSR